MAGMQRRLKVSEKLKNTENVTSKWSVDRTLGILLFAGSAIWLLLFYFDRMDIVDYFLYLMVIGVSLAKKNKS